MADRRAVVIISWYDINTSVNLGVLTARRCLGVSELPRRGEAEPDLRVSNVYEVPSAQDGTRVLVDPTWPRGVSHSAARIHEWFPAVAPSAALRRSLGGESGDFPAFRRRYLDELCDPLRALALAFLGHAARHSRLTLLTADEDPSHSHAAVLAERLRSTAQLQRRSEPSLSGIVQGELRPTA
jgi:uncharacterized protein YeaO (DUF488 family)